MADTINIIQVSKPLMINTINNILNKMDKLLHSININILMVILNNTTKMAHMELILHNRMEPLLRLNSMGSKQQHLLQMPPNNKISINSNMPNNISNINKDKLNNLLMLMEMLKLNSMLLMVKMDNKEWLKLINILNR